MPLASLLPKVTRALAAALVVMAVIAAMIAPTGLSYAQTTGWSTPIPVSPDGFNAWFPDVAVDAAGHVHVAWAGGVDGFDTVWYTNSADGVDWREPNDIKAYAQIGESSIASRPALLVTQDNLLHLTSSNDSVYHSMAPVDQAYSAGAWTAPTKLNGNNTAYFTRTAVDSQGRIHLVYSENLISVECENCYHIYYRHSDDGGNTWTDPVDVSVLPIGAAKPQLLVDDEDNVHLVWEAGFGGGLGQLSDPTQVMHAASYNRGDNWNLPTELATKNNPNPPTMTKNVSIGFDKNRHLVVVWTSLPEDTIQYQLSTDRGRSWTAPQPLRGLFSTWAVYTARLDNSSIVRDAAGNLHLVFTGRRLPQEADVSVFHVMWDGSAWSAPDAIVTLQGDVPEWPRLAVGLGNQLHAVWFVRDAANIWDSDGGNYRVWYARAQAIAPAIAPVPWPTPLPTAEPTATPAPTATPVSLVPPQGVIEPTLAVQPVDMASMAAIQTEVDDVWLIVKSLAPTLVLFLAIAVAVVIRRR
ncbi:MAG: sialidase family protein [Caldilineaceae bacterium]|nr:hypothetical protein [Caldilineaceae bacterium]